MPGPFRRRDPALYSSVRSEAGRRPADAPVGRNHFPEEVRRSLKTQQHVHPRPTLGRESVSRFERRRSVGPRGLATGGAKTYPVNRSGARLCTGAPSSERLTLFVK